MSNILRGLKKIKNDSFTLVELLVVISIIGMLAGLAVPAVNGALEKGKQVTEVKLVKSIGELLYSETGDNNGFFRCNLDLTNLTIGTTLDAFKGLYADNPGASLKGLGANGVPPPTSTNNITADNVGWALGLGVSTSDDSTLPLIISKKSGASYGTADITPDAQKSPWKNKGVVIVTLDCSAGFKKAKNGKILNAIPTNKPGNTAAKILDP